MASEQAESSALDTGGTLNDLASFLADTPDEASDEQDDEPTADDSTGEEADTDEDANSEQDDDDDEPQGDDEDDEPAPVEKKITVKVKGEDGADETLELTTEEIASSYLRQRDYTKKTQELAQRETQAVQFLTTKHEEVRSHYLSQAELARAAVAQIAGIRSESEMAELANTDPAAWVAEQQRQRQLSAYLNTLDQQISGEKQKAAQEGAQRQQQTLQSMYQAAWSELQKDGIDKPKLAKIFGDASKAYGFTPDELGNVYDHRLVKALRDAAAYRELKSQKSAVTKKIAEAPRLPTRQSNPTQTRVDKATESRFKSGRARLDDLARLLA